jgi:hypothetical protein
MVFAIVAAYLAGIPSDPVTLENMVTATNYQLSLPVRPGGHLLF